MRLLRFLFPWFFKAQTRPAPFILPEDCDMPWAEDRGQHDVWKRQMRLDLWRFRQGLTDPCKVDLNAVGLTPGKLYQTHGPLFPLSSDLCAACRRIGFSRLAWATGLECAQESEVLDRFYAEHMVAAEMEAARRYTINKKRAETVAFDFESIDDTVALFDLGPRYGALTSGAPTKPDRPLTVLSTFPQE